MIPILKYILRCIWERKLRTLLIVSAISISSAMFFTSTTISGTMVNMQMDAFRKSYGYTDIVIRAKEGSPSRMFYKNKSDQYARDAEYIIGELTGYGMLEGKTAEEKAGMMFRGIDLADLSRLTPFDMVSEDGLYPFLGRKMVISSASAEKYGLKCGSSAVLEINGAKYRFRICGLFLATGALAESDGSCPAIIPLKTLGSIYDARGRVDTVYIKLRNPERKQRLLYLLSKDYPRYEAREPFTEWELKRETDRVTAPIAIVTVILSFMSIYVIHTTFRIIVLERLPVIGTFRSIGAEKRTTDRILLAESLLYGAAGGISGCVLGSGLLYILAGFTGSPARSGMTVHMAVAPSQYLQTFGIAVLFAIAGSSAAILKTVGMPIKEMVLGIPGEASEIRKSKTGIGLVLLSASFLIPFVAPAKTALISCTAAMVLVMMAVCLLVPFLTESILTLLNPVFSLLPGNIPQLTLRLFRGNGSLYSGVSMVMIGISGLSMIGTLNWSQVRDNETRFERNRYDIVMKVPNADKALLGLISEVDGVSGVLGNHLLGRTGLEGYEEPIWHIQGIRTEEFPSYQDLKADPGSLASLDKGRNILLTNTLKERLGVTRGETILLKFPSGNGGYFRRPYCITGFFDTTLKGMWSYALISDRNFLADTGVRFYGSIYIKTDKDPVKVADSLRSAFSKRQPEIRRKEEERMADLQSSRQLFFMLRVFTGMTLVTGIFGVWNNRIIHFLQRRRQMAMLRSCGMGRLQLRNMILLEAFLQGAAGSLPGIAAGLGTTWIIVPRILLALNLENTLRFSAGITSGCFLAGVLACIVSSAGVLFQTSKLNLIMEIKRE